jgi:large subunit ribosomal protein L1
MPISTESLLAAIKQMREVSPPRKFKQSVDLAITLKDIDPRKSEERISEEVVLPYGVGKPRKIAIFAESELARRAREGGADLVLSRGDIEALQKDRKRARKVAEEHDFFLAQADLMPLIGKQLGPVLGPRGKIPKPMPSTANPKPLIERYRKTVRLRMRDQPTLHVQVGVESMNDEELVANVRAVIEAIERKLERDATRAGLFYVKTTMGKPVRIGVKQRGSRGES